MVIGGDGAEVDWFIGYGPPPEKFLARLERILRGEETFKALQAAYARDPKDAAAAFKLARKWGDRFDEAKAAELYRQVIALDPQGQAGSYTMEATGLTAPYPEHAEYALASQALRLETLGRKADFSPLRAFIAKYPNGKLAKQAWKDMAEYHLYYGQTSKEEAARFFDEFTAKYPDDASVLGRALERLVETKDASDKGREIAEKIEDLTRDNPSSDLQEQLARFYELRGDRAKAERLFGPEFAGRQVDRLASTLVSYANYWLNQNVNLDSAVAMAELALKLKPGEDFYVQRAVRAYAKTGQDEKALALYGPAYVEKQTADAAALSRYATFWAGQGKNLDSALAAAKKAVELKERSYSYWWGLSSVYQKMKNIPEAIKAKEKADAIAPDQIKQTYLRELERLKTQK